MKYTTKIIAGLLLGSIALSATAHEEFYERHSEGRVERREFAPSPGHQEAGFRGNWGGEYRGGYHEENRGGHYHDHDDFGNFIGPALIGGLIGYGLGQPRIVSPNQVYGPPPNVYSAPAAVYTPQAPMVYASPIGYHYQNILDANCNCYRTVLIANQ